MSKILYGTDPECMAVYEKDGQIFCRPPYFFRRILGVPASDDINHPVFLKGDGWTALEDGAAFEFSIRPSHNPRELFDRIQEVRGVVNKQILEKYPEYCLPELQFLPTVGFEVDYWKGEILRGFIDPKSFEMSTRFGCDPDLDELNYKARATVIDVTEHPKRYCGGHLHISGSPKIREDYHLAVRCMIVTAGVAATAFSTHPELEFERTYYYGKPGKYRVQNYGADNPFGPEYAIGIEYRTPSATWAGEWAVAEPFLKWAEIGINTLLETSLGEEMTKELVTPAAEAILNADQEQAHQILSYLESKI